jgi:hypothetical protein
MHEPAPDELVISRDDVVRLWDALDGLFNPQFPSIVEFEEAVMGGEARLFGVRVRVAAS